MQNQRILIKKEHASAPCIEISEKFGVYKERKNFFFSKCVNSLLGDSHNGQFGFQLKPIFTLRRAMLFAADANKKRLAFFQN